jgi:multisubunit Na+/H+ antiporter MnhB subunit
MPPPCLPSASSFRPRTILTAAALIVGVAIVLWVVWARHLPHRRRLRHGQLLISLIAGVATTIVLYAMYLHLTEALYRTRTDDPFLTIACSRRALAADVP